MQNKEQVVDAKLNSTSPQQIKIEVQVENFPTATPKFTKAEWDSGEGGDNG